MAGSSGGVTSALALYCLEQEKMRGVLHTAARRDIPYLNHTIYSRRKEELLAATGSRYAPASPADGLGLIEKEDGVSLFIGKPCDVAGVRKVCNQKPDLQKKIGLTLSLFCAGTPALRGTFTIFEKMGINDISSIQSLRYRGMGWPGKITACVKSAGKEEKYEMSYEVSWEILAKHLPWRCYLCPDHTGEFADISLGDPWYRAVSANEEGASLILIRTETGRRLFKDAVEKGYVRAERVKPDILPLSQPDLLRARGAVWARSSICRLLGIMTPQYHHIPMFSVWCQKLTWQQKCRPVIKQILKRKLYKKWDLTAKEIIE